MAPSQKLIQTWLIQVWTTGFEAGKAYRSGDDEPKPPEDWSHIIDQPEKLKVTPLTHGSKLPFDPTKCHARMFKNPGGFEVQCTRVYTSTDGQCLCGIHQKQYINLPTGAKDIPFGRYNQERPQYTLNNAKDGEPIQGDKLIWSDQKQKKSDCTMTKKKVTSAKMRTDLKSWQVTHDGIKGKELTLLYNKELAKREKAIALDSNTTLNLEIDSSSQQNNDKESPTLSPESPHYNDTPVSEDPVEGDTEPEPESEHESEPEPDKIEEYSVITEHSRPDGSKYQVEIITPDPKTLETLEKVGRTEKVDGNDDNVPSTVKEFKEFFKEKKDIIEDLGISIDGLRGKSMYTAKYHEILEAIKDHENFDADDNESGDETEDMSDDEIDYVETTYEEIDYLEDENSDKVFNLQKQHVGDWDENGNIVWKNKSFQIEHNHKVKNL